MADVRDINPLQPIWPKRPTDKVGPGRHDPEQQKKRDKRDEKKDSDDDGEGIDEYV